MSGSSPCTCWVGDEGQGSEECSLSFLSLDSVYRAARSVLPAAGLSPMRMNSMR
jgi:hypothetical protein